MRCFRHPTRDLIASRRPARQALAILFHVEQVGGLAGIVEGKQGGGFIAGLLFAFRKINGRAEDAGWGASLQPLQLNTSI